MNRDVLAKVIALLGVKRNDPFLQQPTFGRIKVAVHRCSQVGSILGLLDPGITACVSLTVFLVYVGRNRNAGSLT